MIRNSVNTWWRNLSKAQKSFYIIQCSIFSAYILAQIAYTGEKGHFGLSPQVLLWILATAMWLIKSLVLDVNDFWKIKALKLIYVTAYVIADFLIVLFIVGMIDLSVTDRGIRRTIGLAIPIPENPPQVRAYQEIFNANDIGGSLRFYSEEDKNLVEINLEYVPIPETVELWEGVLNLPPSYFKIVKENVLVSHTNFTEESFIEASHNMSFTVTYSWSTRENSKNE